MTGRSRHVITLALLSVVHGCAKHHAEAEVGGACANNTRADVFATGLTKRGADGRYQFKLLAATPAPPARGDNAWVLEIDAVNGTSVTGAAVTATPFMPDHGHGTPMQVRVTPLSAPGQYQLAPLNLWMPGYWETSVAATSGGVGDSAIFKFCIPN